jgi:hypothetical protein
MPNQHDRILKENFFLGFLPVLGKLLKLPSIRHTEEIPEKIQHTLEREPDFVRIVETEGGERFILHLEFQTSNDSSMLKRMAEYHALLQRRFDLPVRPYVLYFGKDKPSMQTQLPKDRIFRGFELLNFQQLPAEDFLASDRPEEVLLAILGEFGTKLPEDMVEQILHRLRELCPTPATLSKYAEQLAVLSGLRSLQKITHQKIKNMAIDFDLTNNFIYKEGIEKGLEQGLGKGKEETLNHNLRRLIEQKVLNDQQIADVLEIPLSRVKQLRKELEEGAN